MKDEIGIIEFITERFPTEESAVQFFVEKRWGGKITCPYCSHDKVYNVKGGQPYKCAKCRLKFTAKTGTIMEGSKVPMQKWLLAMYIMGTSRKGISSVQMAKNLRVTQKTAWYMAQRIREACDNAGRLSGTVEVDETFHGGKEKNRHASKKSRKGRGIADKTTIVGLRERNGTMRGQVVAGTDRYTLHSAVYRHVSHGATVYTDDHASYVGISKNGYAHDVVKHSQGEYVRDDVHTNGIESSWALLKRGIYGTYHHVSRKHLQRYVNEFAFRISRGTSMSFIDAVCGNVNGNALSWKKLTA